MKNRRTILKLIAVALSMAICLGLFTSTANAETNQTDTSKSKTATSDLQANNFESEVTLSIPANEENIVSDIVFIMDASSIANVSMQEMLQLLSDLKTSIGASNATINVGVILFRGNAQIGYPLTAYTGDNTPITTALGNKYAEMVTSATALRGSNLPAGLQAAQDMLEASATQKDRQFVLCLSDGGTYLYTHDGDPTTHYSRTSGYVLSGYSPGGLFEWSSKYSQRAGNLGNTPTGLGWPWTCPQPNSFTNNGDVADWENFLFTYLAPIRANFTQYDCVYTRTGATGLTPLTPPDPVYTQTTIGNFVTCTEESLYQTAVTWKELVATGNNCYAIKAGDVTDQGVFHTFMDYLGAIGAGSAADFDAVKNDILYLLGAGSTVVDEIGFGTDDHGNAYNFDFVNNAAKLSLTVDDTTYSCAASTQTLENGETARYIFTANGVTPDNAAEAPYVLHYYEDGITIDGKTYKEGFVWDINKHITNFSKISLKYTVKLTNPQTRVETTTTFGGLDTNNSATLFPVDSQGTKGTPEEFGKPKVSYAVDPPTGITATFKGTKTLMENGNNKAIVKDQFTFSIAASASNDTTGYTGFTAGDAKVEADGSFAFGEITFIKAGTYIFTVSERNEGAAGYTYDSSPVTVTYTVKLNETNNSFYIDSTTYTKNNETSNGIVFTNSYKAPDNPNAPKTSDDSPIALYIALMAINLAGMGFGMTYLKKKKRIAE